MRNIKNVLVWCLLYLCATSTVYAESFYWQSQDEVSAAASDGLNPQVAAHIPQVQDVANQFTIESTANDVTAEVTWSSNVAEEAVEVTEYTLGEDAGYLHLGMDAASTYSDGQSNVIETEIDFSQPIKDVSFSILDVFH